MARYDASTATCHVFTYKEGLLSKLEEVENIRGTRLQEFLRCLLISRIEEKWVSSEKSR